MRRGGSRIVGWRMYPRLVGICHASHGGGGCVVLGLEYDSFLMLVVLYYSGVLWCCGCSWCCLAVEARSRCYRDCRRRKLLLNTCPFSFWMMIEIEKNNNMMRMMTNQ